MNRLTGPDFSRSLNYGYFTDVSDNSSNYQFFRVIPCYYIPRGGANGERRSDKIGVLRVRGNVRLGNEQIAQNWKRSHQEISISREMHSLNPDIPLNINLPSTDLASSGMQYEFVAPVPGDATGSGFQTPLTQVTTNVPDTHLSITSEGGHFAETYTETGYNPTQFSTTFAPKWEPNYNLMTRFILFTTDFILDPSKKTGEDYFNLKDMMPILNLASPSQNSVSIGSFFKQEVYEHFRVLIDIKKMNSKGFVDFNFDITPDQLIEFQEGATNPRFAGYNPVLRTGFEPMRNNLYVMVFTEPLSYMYNGNIIYHPF